MLSQTIQTVVNTMKHGFTNGIVSLHPTILALLCLGLHSCGERNGARCVVCMDQYGDE